MTKVTIGIQARSTSTRLPNKISAKIGDKTMLQRVVNNCTGAAQYINNWGSKSIFVDVVLLVPEGDPITGATIPIVSGSEHDVLSRYVCLLTRSEPDYVCRITADCPLIPSFLISKLITLATMNGYDYVSNVDERCRTAADGTDCEVISAKALEYAHRKATDDYDKEHVTTLLRRCPPPWLKAGAVVSFFDLSNWKLSVDTETDLNRVRQEFDKVEKAYENAVKLFGRKAVHRV